MGGSAFTRGPQPLLTPRMPKEVYSTVKARSQEILRELYHHVATPIEGPEKSDFGDIDILVASPRAPKVSTDQDMALIGSRLDAQRVIVNKGDQGTGHFALAWPSSIGEATRNASTTDAVSESTDADGSKDLPKHIQLDVRICDSVETLEWMMFKHGHGDLWNIVGSFIRFYGLTVNDNAFWIRVAEIEKIHKNRARVFLTKEPAKVLQFLGLPFHAWDKPFDCLQEMFEYAAQCRFFHIREKSSVQDGEAKDVEAGAGDYEQLKSIERKKLRQRPAFKVWVEEFVPQCRESGRFTTDEPTREEVSLLACEAFQVEEEFVRRRDDFLLERQRDTIWNKVIKGIIPYLNSSDNHANQYRNCQVKAIKRVILEDDDSYGAVPGKDIKDEKGFFVMDNVVDFITKNKDIIGDAALARHNSVFAKTLREREEQASQE